MIGITKTGEWFLYEGDINKIFDETWEYDHKCIPVVSHLIERIME